MQKRTRNFTDASIRALQPTEKQIDYWDANVTGLLLRVSRGGTKTFQVYYRYKGRQRRLSLGRFPHLTLAAARDKCHVTLAAVIEGRDPAGVKKAESQAETFKVLALDYLEQYAKCRKRTWKEDERLINTELLPEWGSRKAIHISRQDVRRLLQRIKNRAPIIANHTLSLVRTIFNFAIENDWLDANPCYRVPLPTKPSRRERTLSVDEIAGLWNSLETESVSIQRILRLQLLTAQRIGEIRQMRPSDIDLNTKWWTIPAEVAKNGRAHRVPLSQPALEILEKGLKEGTQSWVFPASRDRVKPVGYQTIHKVVQKIRATSPIKWASHDLRRTVVSNLTSAGVSTTTAARILNHAEYRVIGVYDRHSYDPEKRIALDAWARTLLSIIEGQRTKGTILSFAK